MKKIIKMLALPIAVALSAASLSGCGGKSVLLKGAADAYEFTYQDSKSDEYIAIADSAEQFAANFASAAFSELDEAKNFAVSPVSVYMALSMAAECAEGNTKQELLDALGIDYETLQDGFACLYNSLNRTYKSGMLTTSNSVWVNQNTVVEEDGLNSLSDKFFTDSYSADFEGDNDGANRAVRDYVKDKTNGLIDRNFALGPETYFALINTLYLKDSWNLDGKDLEYTEEEYQFAAGNGDVVSKKLLRGAYSLGRVYEGETFSSFFTSTAAGFKIKFIVPKDGFTLSEVFTAENIALANSVTDYQGLDDENLTRYYTRCLFPEFTADYSEDVIGILNKYFGISDLFDEGACDLSKLLKEENQTKGADCCTSISHITKLTVDKKGIEGAAVTALVDAGTSAPPYEEVYCDFIVDRAFGYIITDNYGTTLFSGVINN